MRGGTLKVLFCSKELSSAFPSNGIKQVNHSFTRQKGTVRGLHFQYPPHAETKLITCLSGAVFDVAVCVAVPDLLITTDQSERCRRPALGA